MKHEEMVIIVSNISTFTLNYYIMIIKINEKGISNESYIFD